MKVAHSSSLNIGYDDDDEKIKIATKINEKRGRGKRGGGRRTGGFLDFGEFVDELREFARVDLALHEGWSIPPFLQLQ